LPKALIEQTGLGEDITLRAVGSRIIIEGRANPRAGWVEAAKAVNAEHGNELTEEDREWLDAPLSSEFDEKEWTW
jgi:antitoxin MazE